MRMRLGYITNFPRQ